MDVRREAKWRLKHFMHDYELDKLAELAPQLLVDDFRTDKQKEADEAKLYTASKMRPEGQ